MSWILGGVYCGLIWMVFAKLKLFRLSLPLAIVLASVGPSLIVALLLCAQYLHPFSPSAIVLEQVDPITVQLTQPGRVIKVVARPNVPIRKGDVLFEIDKQPYLTSIRMLESELAQSKQNVELAKSTIASAEASLKRAQSELSFAKIDRDRLLELGAMNAVSDREAEEAETRFDQADAILKERQEQMAQAQLSLKVAEAKVIVAASALSDARYDLAQTSILAPADGFVVNAQVREGLLVSAGSGPVMTYVREKPADAEGVIVATFAEKNFLRIRSGQYAEVAMKGYPGQILTGRVLNTIDVSGTGQLFASGQLPTSLSTGKPSQFAVRIRLDDASIRLPGGAQGEAAIYTDDLQVAGLPVMFLIRAKSWVNFLF